MVSFPVDKNMFKVIERTIPQYEKFAQSWQWRYQNDFMLLWCLYIENFEQIYHTIFVSLLLIFITFSADRLKSSTYLPQNGLCNADCPLSHNKPLISLISALK